MLEQSGNLGTVPCVGDAHVFSVGQERCQCGSSSRHQKLDDHPARRSDLTALDDRIRHLERIAALRHPELYRDPEGTFRQLANQGGLSEPVPVEEDAPKVAGQEYDD